MQLVPSTKGKTQLLQYVKFKLVFESSLISVKFLFSFIIF